MSAAIYWLAIRCYAIILRIASVFNPKAKLFFEGRKNLLSRVRYALINERRHRIWMHCASLGEFEQGRPVLEKLRKQHPDHAIVLTFFSPSGYEVRKDYNGADYIFYLPLDSVFNARRFLQIVQPKLCIFVKYEFWYFFLTEMARRDIPVILISAIFNKDQPFFQWYGALHKRMLYCFSHIFVQDNESAFLLNQLNIEAVTVSGDSRFDRVKEAAMQQQSLIIADNFCEGKNIIVAGSTWIEDEFFLKKVVADLSPDWRLILVPHDVFENRIKTIEYIFEGKTVRWSEWSVVSDKQVLIVDQVGLLLQLYKYAKVAWIGGGFGKEGVHNILEAAVYGKPVAFGPIYNKFLEAKELIEVGGGVTTGSSEVFVKQIQQWDADHNAYKQAAENAANYVLSKTGATAHIINYIEAKNWLKIK